VTVTAHKINQRRVVFEIRNDGNARATFSLRKNTRVQSPGRGPANPPSGRKSPIVITYHMGNANITNALERNRASMTLAPGETGRVLAKVRVLRPLAFRRVIRLALHATHQTQASASHGAAAKIILPATRN
jgi:hypothetical protein